jgi:hypothetical protein
MTIFPELEPASRSYDFGLFPLTEVPSSSAGIIRFRHGTTATNYQLALNHVYLTTAEAELIRTHYATQGGGNIAFSLPAIIWKGHTFSGNVAPASMLWRYAAPPEEQHLSGGYFNITVALQSDGTPDPSLGTVTAALTVGAATV